MRFELRERLETAPADAVLRSLEFHLRTVAQDVVRMGDQLAAYGIGPSPRSVNKNDMTLVHARVEAGTTLLAIEVNYQASALLGGISQDDVVRSKIVGVLREVRRELGLRDEVQPPADRTAQAGSPTRYAAGAERVYEQEHAAPSSLPARPRAMEQPPMRAAFVAEPVEERAAVERAAEPEPELPLELVEAPELVKAPPVEARVEELRPVPEVVTAPIVDERKTRLERDPVEPSVVKHAAQAVVAVEREREETSAAQVDEVAAREPEMPLVMRRTTEVPSRIELRPEPLPERPSETLPEPVAPRTEAAVASVEEKTRLVEPVVAAAELPAAKEMSAVAEEGRADAPVVTEPLPEPRRLGLKRARAVGPLVGQAAAEPAAGVEAAKVEAGRIEPASVEADRLTNVRVPFEAWPVSPVDEEAPQRSKAPWIVLLALLAALGGLYAWRGPEIVSRWIAPTIARWREGMGMASPATPEAQAPAATPATEAAPAVAPRSLMAKPTEAVVTEWVRDWAEAEASSDAEAQASYYAEPVERYFLRSRLSNAAILQEKQAAIASRPPQFSFTIEDLVVERESATDARVRLVKHVESRTTSQIASQRTRVLRVRSLLVLKRVDGAWKIVQERDLL